MELFSIVNLTLFFQGCTSAGSYLIRGPPDQTAGPSVSFTIENGPTLVSYLLRLICMVCQISIVHSVNDILLVSMVKDTDRSTGLTDYVTSMTLVSFIIFGTICKGSSIEYVTTATVA